MALTHWAFIYVAEGCDPARDVSVVDTGACRTVLVGVGRAEQVVEAAASAAADGAQLIELCGGFGPEWTARVIREVGDRAAVGSVGYGPESIGRLHAIFS